MALSTDLISWWKLDEGSGTLADSVGSNDGTNAGASYGATGIIGDCMDFENSGTDQYVDCGSSAGNWDVDSPFSISLWAKFESSSGQMMVLTKQSKNGSPNWYGWNVSINFAGPYMTFEFGGSGGTLAAVKSTTVSTATWYHFVWTYDGSQDGSGLHFYQDGTELTSLNVTSNTLAGSATNSISCCIGGRQDDVGTDGLLDEIGIWDRALTQSEVTELYNSGSGITYPFPVNATVTPGSLAISTTAEGPTIVINVPPLAVSSLLQNPAPSIITQSIPGTRTGGTYVVGIGTVGTRFLDKKYPNVEGLLAGTTKQTIKPSL